MKVELAPPVPDLDVVTGGDGRWLLGPYEDGTGLFVPDGAYSGPFRIEPTTGAFAGWTITGTIDCGNTTGQPQVDGMRATGTAHWNGDGPSPYPGGYTRVGFGAREHGDLETARDPIYRELYGTYCSPLVADASPSTEAPDAGSFRMAEDAAPVGGVTTRAAETESFAETPIVTVGAASDETPLEPPLGANAALEQPDVATDTA